MVLPRLTAPTGDHCAIHQHFDEEAEQLARHRHPDGQLCEPAVDARGHGEGITEGASMFGYAAQLQQAAVLRRTTQEVDGGDHTGGVRPAVEQP